VWLAPNQQLKEATPHEHEHQVRTDQRRRHGAEYEIGRPAERSPAIRLGAPVARSQKIEPRPYSYRRNRCAAARAGSPHPQRGRFCEEQDRQGHDHDYGRQNESEPSNDGPEWTGEPVGAKDCELGRSRSRQQIAGGDGVLEGTRIHPAPLIDDELAQQDDVGGRSPEPNHPDSCPLARDDRKRRLLLATHGLGSQRSKRGLRLVRLEPSDLPARDFGDDLLDDRVRSLHGRMFPRL
jgi:hypothetical protein